MAISPIEQSVSLVNMKEVKKKLNPTELKSGEENPTAPVADKANLSPEAIKLHEAQMQDKMTEIQGKIESGFYNSDEVLSAVAGSLVKVVRGK